MPEEILQVTWKGFNGKMSFVHLSFKGVTTSPWHIGERAYGDYLYTRRDMLWGRGVRGPVLAQLWRTYCYKSNAYERVSFDPNRDCKACRNAEGCPFLNLRGTGEGEFKDKPRLIITNLRFAEKINPGVLVLVSRDDRYLGVVRGKGPIRVEYIPEGTRFELEVILQERGAEFEEDVEKAIEVSLKFFGWGGFCNEGFGRGKMIEKKSRDFEDFERDIILPIAENMKDEREILMKIEPILILKDGKRVFRSIRERGFLEKFIHSINERYWQFYNRNIYVPIKNLSGMAREVRIRYWSRKDRRGGILRGLGNELTIYLKDPREEHLKAIALCRYGIGRLKNMGFGCLVPSVRDSRPSGIR
jgi:hypothetical protein